MAKKSRVWYYSRVQWLRLLLIFVQNVGANYRPRRISARVGCAEWAKQFIEYLLFADDPIISNVEQTLLTDFSHCRELSMEDIES